MKILENSVEAAKRRRENIEKAEIIVGKNYIRVLKVLQCDVCQRYIPLEGKEENEVIRLHCSSRLHMNSYVNFKECIDLKKKAERIQDLSDSESHVPIEITEVSPFFRTGFFSSTIAINFQTTSNEVTKLSRSLLLKKSLRTKHQFLVVF